MRYSGLSNYLRFALALIVVSAPLAVAAYPISPVTLWNLVEGSEVVVLAEVVSVRKLPREGDSWAPTHQAELRPLEFWKGNAEKSLMVGYHGTMICPAPPRYVEGKQVVAFLFKDDDGAWRTNSLSYGTRYLREAEVEPVGALVADAIEIQKAGKLHGGVPERKRIGWLVDAATMPATRWDGLYELVPLADTLLAHYDQRDPEELKEALLSPQELRRIAEAFVRDVPTGSTFEMSLSLLRDYPSEKIDRLALAVIEARLERNSPWWLKDAMPLVLARFDDPRIDERMTIFPEDYSEPSMRAVRKMWKTAIEDLGLPEVSPVPLETHEVWGVGGTTPD